MRRSTWFLIPLLTAGVWALATACMSGPEGPVAPLGVTPNAPPVGIAMPKALEVRGRLLSKKVGQCELDLRVSNIEPTVDYEIHITDSEGPVILAFEPPGNTRSWFSIPPVEKPASYWASYARYLELWGVTTAGGSLYLASIMPITPEMINNRCF